MKFLILLLLFIPFIGFSQTILMNANGNSSTCTGNFYDSGGNAAGNTGKYAANQSFVWTICPSSPGLISMNFTTFDVEGNWDLLEVFDGNSVAATSLGAYDNNVPLLGVVQATNANPTGCLTFRFTSDGSGQYAGWAATISCVEPCQSVQASITATVPAVSSGIIKICQGDNVTFNGGGVYSQNNLYYAQANATSTYLWTMTGTAGTSTIATQNGSQTYVAEGIYHVALEVTDVNGCVSTNAEELLIEVSTTPVFVGTVATQPSICIGATNTITGVVTPVPYTEDCTPPAGAQISLPDGTGVSYTNLTTISCFTAGQTITNANQIASICMNMEHSYVGDLDITITCPTGQSVILIDYETGTNTGGEYLGTPVDNDAAPTAVGTGANYCFTNGAAQSINTACATIANSVMIPAGNYLPVGAFTGLVGCELNGDWVINIQDNLGSDNGTIFSWSVDFANITAANQVSFTPTVVSQSFTADPTIVSTTANVITVLPTAVGSKCYTYSMTDNFGCTYDTSVCFNVVAGPVLVITDPAAVCIPATVNITAAAVTAGSTGGGTLTYWSDAACTIAVAAPSAISVSGTYYIKATAGACTDINPVVVTINPVPVLVIADPAAVCQPLTVDITAAAVTAGSTGGGTLSYWTDAAGTIALATPAAITVSGTYYIKSTLGTCTDINPVVVTVNTTPVLTITNPAAVCSPLTVSITGAAVTAGSTGGGTLSYWTDAAATIALGTPAAITTSGTYYIKSTLGTCFDINPVVVTINPPPVNVITNPAAICMPFTIDITAAAVTAGSTGGGILTYWSDAACTISLASPAALTTSGTYYIKSTVGSCFDIDAVTIAVNDCSCPVVVVITNPAAVCQPLTVDLTLPAVTAGSTGGGTLTYWSDIACTIPLASSNAITTSGIYYIQSDDGTCTDSKPVTVTVNTTPVLTITDPTAVCQPLTVDITAAGVTAGSTGSGTLTYWTDVACTSSLASPAAIATTGTYYIKSTVGSCEDIAPVSVVVNTTPVLSITAPLAVCIPGTVDITVAAVTTGSTGGGVLTYWNDVAATSALATPAAIATSGTYYIQSTLLTCTDIEPVIVVVSASPVLTIIDPASVCQPATVDITAAAVTAGSTGSGTLTYWTDAACTASLASPAAIATSGTYYIKSTVGSCVDSAPVTVVVNTTPVLSITPPLAVCAPGAIDITAAAVTAGSTGGGVLTYWTNALCTTALATPSAIAASGTYYIQSTLVACTDSEPVIVTINPTPSLNISNPAAVCSPLTVNLTVAAVTAGSTGGGVLTYWTDAACTAPLSAANAVATSGTYYIKSAIGTCTDSEQVVVVVNTTPVLVITNPAAVCSPSTVDLNVPAITAGSTGAGTLTYWTNAACTNSLATASAVTMSGTYYIQSMSNTCFDVEPVIVVVNMPITPLFSTFAPLCEDDIAPILLPSSFNVPQITGSWVPALIDVNTPGTVLHTFTPTAGQCATTTSLNIVVNPKPLLFITAPAAICAPGVIDLTNPAVTAGSTGVLTYFTNASLTTPIANPSAMTTSGTYFIKATSNLGCFDYLPVVIAVNPKPIADFTPTPSVLNMYNLTSVMVNTSIGADTYEWVFEDNSETSTSVSPSHTYADDIFGEQVINLIVTSADGCKDTTVGVVNIEEELVFYVPNAFTPDADDHNPGFLPVFTSGYDPFNYTMWIYNRWGELIFETHDTEIGWRGLYGVDGVQAQDGVYTWKMEFKLKDKDKHVQHVGHVTLVR